MPKSEERKLDPKVIAERKKMFNKRTHYRNFEIDRKLYPTSDIEEQDRREMVDYYNRFVMDKSYLRIMDDWQVNMAKRRAHKLKTKQLFEAYEKPGEDVEKFVVHNPEKALTLPPLDENLFAVVCFKGSQHKVTKDDIIQFEKIDDLNPGDCFLFDQVLLVASNEYTSLGRPYISTCKVLATVEEKSRSEKVIVFKKKRRKGYQRNQGHRQDLTYVRILKIVHNPPQEILDNYHSLI
jgi:large subunit ribosomal protein L21